MMKCAAKGLDAVSRFSEEELVEVREQRNQSVHIEGHPNVY
jgi:PleD family two-component response regulator